MNVAGDSVPVFVRTLRKSSPSAPSTGRGRLFFCLYLAASRRNSCSLALLDRSPSMRRVSLLLSIGLLAACGETSAPSGSEAAAATNENEAVASAEGKGDGETVPVAPSDRKSTRLNSSH